MGAPGCPLLAFSTASIERKRMALMDRHATSLLMVDSERVWTFDKAVRLGCIRDLDAPNYEIGNLSDSIRECGLQKTSLTINWQKRKTPQEYPGTVHGMVFDDPLPIQSVCARPSTEEEMIKLVSWNIAKRQQPWRDLLEMDVDVALLQEAGDPPLDIRDKFDMGDPEVYDSHRVYSSDYQQYWPNLLDRWCRVVKLSDRVDVDWFKQIPPVAEPPSGTIPTSGIGTIAAARITPTTCEAEPFIAISMYGRWMGSHPPEGRKTGAVMPDTSIHRIISDISLFVGHENPSTHRVLTAGDINLDHGVKEEGISWYGRRARVVWDRFDVLGFEYLGPQYPNGRRATPRPNHLPDDTKNVPTFMTSRMTPLTAQIQLDHVFASRGFHETINTRALNSPDEWGSSDHCRLLIEIDV